LLPGDPFIIKITDQTDTDRTRVHIVRPAVGPFLLFNPPGRDFNLPVDLPFCPVINDKVVTDALLETPVQMGVMEGQRTPFIGGTVVDNNIFPFFVRIKRDNRLGGSRLRNA